jgi:hypothetical protein
MNKNYWLNLVITLCLLNPTTLPVFAQTAAANLQEQNSSIQLDSNRTTPTIPQSTAIVVTFPSDFSFDVGDGKNYPITLRLAEPIMDNKGNIVAPANSPVDATLLPIDGDAQIVAKSLIINGKLVPIQAVSRTIPSVKVTLKSRMEQATNYAQSFGSVSSPIIGFTDQNNSNNTSNANLLSHGIGAIVGFLSPQYQQVANFVKGSEYILVLEEEVALPSNNSSGVDRVAEVQSVKIQN